MLKILRSSWHSNQSAISILTVRCRHSVADVAANRLKVTSILKESHGFTHRMAELLFMKCGELQAIHCDTIISSVETLRNLNYSPNEIISQAALLKCSARQLRMRYEILMEVGFDNVTPYRLTNYNAIMSRSAQHNESYFFLPKHRNIVDNIQRVAGLPPDASRIVYDTSDSLATIHQSVTKKHLKKRLRILDGRIPFKWRERSLSDFAATMQAIEQHFGENVAQLPRSMVRYAPGELEQLLSMGPAFGLDMRAVIKRIGSATIHLTVERCEWFEALARRYGIAGYSIYLWPHVVRMDPQRIQRHIDRIARLPEPEQFLRHPFVMRLVRDMERFEEFSAAKSLNFDDIFDATFANFYLSSHFISKRIAFSYLALRLSRCRDQIRLKWQAHQQLPAAVNEIHETLEYLFGAGFSADEIFECIYIVSYPKCAVEAACRQLESPAERMAMNIHGEIPRSKLLPTCAFVVEQKADSQAGRQSTPAECAMDEALEAKAFIQSAFDFWQSGVKNKCSIECPIEAE